VRRTAFRREKHADRQSRLNVERAVQLISDDDAASTVCSIMTTRLFRALTRTSPPSVRKNAISDDERRYDVEKARVLQCGKKGAASELSIPCSNVRMMM